MYVLCLNFFDIYVDITDSNDILSPMGSNVICFSKFEDAANFARILFTDAEIFSEFFSRLIEKAMIDSGFSGSNPSSSSSSSKITSLEESSKRKNTKYKLTLSKFTIPDKGVCPPPVKRVHFNISRENKEWFSVNEINGYVSYCIVKRDVHEDLSTVLDRNSKFYREYFNDKKDY